MPRANLSTRPFYNERPVRAVLGVVAAIAVALTIFNVVQILQLRSRGAEVQQQAESAERDAARLRNEAVQIRRTINREQLAAVQTAALEANQLIDRRAFSWTDLFNRFESTLPAEVRLASVTPQVDASGQMLVAVTVVSRRVEDLDGFIDALERTGAFREVLSRQEEAQEDGTLRSIIQGYYRGAPAQPAQASSEAVPAPEAPVTARAETPR